MALDFAASRSAFAVATSAFSTTALRSAPASISAARPARPPGYWSTTSPRAAPSNRRLTLSALRMAIRDRQPPAELVHHTDRGGQYASARYRAVRRRSGLRQSMSRAANCYDNAFMESFYKTLKYEDGVHLGNYETYQDVIERLPFFLEEVYNRKRLHSSIGYVPPTEFEAAPLSQT